MPRLTGIFAAAATPLTADHSIDEDKLVGHCRWLLDEGGCDGINLLGTTGEATCFSVEQRIATMSAIASSGLPMDRFMVGTGAAALEDAVDLTRAASDFGFAGALLLPPFYYKGIREEALTSYVATIIKRSCGGGDLGLFLYHIPQMSGVPYSARVLKDLLARFPQIIAGVKDSSGDLQHAQSLAEQFPSLSIFPGSEAILARTPDVKFAGCISGTTNVTGAIVSRGWQMRGKESGAKILQAALEIRTAIEAFPLIPAVKWLLADMQKEDGWRRVHPPLTGLSEADWRGLRDRLATMGFFDQHEGL